MTFDEIAALVARRAGPAIVLGGGGAPRVLVAPALQGRVLTSELAGGASAAFVDAREIEAGERDAAFLNYGGQDRIWLGPEGGRFGLFFPPGAPIEGAHWRAPAALQRGAFEVVERGPRRVAMRRTVTVENRAGAAFRVRLDREVELADPAGLGAPPAADVRATGSRATTTMANVGGAAWSEEIGLPFLWVIAQLPASPRAEAIAPYRRGARAELGPIATSDYFGAPPAGRVRAGRGVVRMRADARRVVKFGLNARRATGRAGAFDPERGRLAVVEFDLPPAGARVPSNLWPIDAPAPFGGDVFQCFNGGDGRYFELESASHARALAPGDSIAHRHATYFFEGPRAALAAVCRAVLGAPLPRL